jgi:hypothetical protein
MTILSRSPLSIASRTIVAITAAALVGMWACGGAVEVEQPTALPVSVDTVTSPDAEPANGCPGGREASILRLGRLEEAVVDALDEYDGTWGFALIDLDCETSVAVNPQHGQYPASAAKVVTVIAALRQVEAGETLLEEVWDHVEAIMHHSWDLHADQLTEIVMPETIADVLALAGVSSSSRFQHDWRRTFMTPMDLARVWASLIGGDLLGEFFTGEVLRLAAEAEVPSGLETFPNAPEIPGYRFGQKAGYYVEDGTPYYLVGAGYLAPADGRGLGLATVLMVETRNPELLEPQRRKVFPAVVRYALDGG